ncbi:metalloregulator ArsR/SmtB family transcription factor [Amycolatopsis cynarae]|uniref:Metalloregulator ArsR/SmtB family transcription factor n=1 Tax=Amycolatopsis cynarae TaxID=2995223 RepID=A0ABY7BBP4_9PSEU|nr:metalloregulator ArsR/SmtB family transcription factor [Amycolatopsis sp. HUAS 11-8]WAL69784.1 metalloregulator ArsR/SmtB family transcription factor [Amycolatopsis sp. HUAS 11-8]
MPTASPDAAVPGLPDEVHAAGPAQPPAPAPPSPTLAAAGELLRALSAPVRIAIVLQLRDADRCVHELVDALDVTQPLISQHLRVLKAAGVVSGQRRGREVVYRLVDDHLAHIVLDAVAHAQESDGGHDVKTQEGA